MRFRLPQPVGRGADLFSDGVQRPGGLSPCEALVRVAGMDLTRLLPAVFLSLISKSKAMKQVSYELYDAINELIVEAECVVQSNGKIQIDIDSLRTCLNLVYTIRARENFKALERMAHGSKPGGISHGG